MSSTILKGREKDKKQSTTGLLLKLQRTLCTRNGSNTVYQLPVTKQNIFLPITIDKQQGLNKHYESRVITAAIKTLIIRAIIAQNNIKPFKRNGLPCCEDENTFR